MVDQVNIKMSSPTNNKKATDPAKKSKSGSSHGDVPNNPPEIEKEKEKIEGSEKSENEQVARWEKQWVAVQNVIEFAPEIWVKKWVLVHDTPEIRKRSDSHSQYSEFSAHESFDEKPQKKAKKDINRKYICQFQNCGKIFSDSSSLRKHMATHGEKMVFLNIQNYS